MKKRLIWGLLLGAILGVLCIIGAQARMPGELSAVYLFAFWYNRLLMGLVIGLFSKPKTLVIGIARGVVLGAVVSFAFFGATEFLDPMGFVAGIVYGILIEAALYLGIKSPKNG
jgi:hypothetical protein